MSAPRRGNAGLDAWTTLIRSLFGFIPFTLRLIAGLPGVAARRRRLERRLADRPRCLPGPPAEPTAARGRYVYLIAGEASGDALGADLARALRERDPDVRIEGLGGAKMAAAGVHLHTDLVSHAVMGFLPVLRHVPRLFRLYRDTLQRFDDDPPDVIVGVDYPGWNLRIAGQAQRRGLKFVQLVAPQIWAWAPWRARALARDVTEVLAVLPFEPAVLEPHGVTVEYVGHPLFERSDATPRDDSLAERLRAGDGPLVALLPGSRRGDIRDNLPFQLAVARRVARERPDARFVIPLASERVRATLEGVLAAEKGRGHPRIRVTPPGTIGQVLDVADVALSKSGTSTLDLVAHETPAVIAYVVPRGGRILAAGLLEAPFIALPNLLAGRELLPEFLVRPGDAGRVTERLLAFLPGTEAHAAAKQELAELRAELVTDDVARRAAAAVLAVADR